APLTSDLAYLISVGLVAGVVIGIFFYIGFCSLAPLTELIRQSVTGDRVTTNKSLPFSVSSHQGDAWSAPTEAELPLAAVAAPIQAALLAQVLVPRQALAPENSNAARDSGSAASEAPISAATGVSSAEVPALRSTVREVTLTPPATTSPL